MNDDGMVTPEPEKEDEPKHRSTRAQAKVQAEEEVVEAQKDMFETGTWSGLPQWTCKVPIVHQYASGSGSPEGVQWAKERTYEMPCNRDTVRDWDRFKEHMFDEHHIVLRDAAQPQEE